MWHVGLDLHRTTVVLAAVSDAGEAICPITIPCSDTVAILDVVKTLGMFRAVIEATATYRWLYDLLRPYGSILLAHPMRLRAMIQRRSKTDKLDAQLLANLLRINQIPLAYIPPEPYQQLRDLTRSRARLGRHLAEVKIQLRALLARQNRQSPYRTPFGPRGLEWFRGQDFGAIEDMVRDELLERFRHYARQMTLFDKRLEQLWQTFPQVEALLDIRGIGLYSALLIVAELGEVERFRTAKQVGAYTGLTSRVHQSGGHCYQGSITRQGSPWLRWALVQVAMKAVHSHDDLALANFYRRIRKRSGAKIARVAAARKLAEICWKRLRQWHRQRAGQAA
jgi:transposase